MPLLYIAAPYFRLAHTGAAEELLTAHEYPDDHAKKPSRGVRLSELQELSGGHRRYSGGKYDEVI